MKIGITKQGFVRFYMGTLKGNLKRLIKIDKELATKKVKSVKEGVSV